MRELTVNGHRIEIYDDVESLPVARFHKYNKMLLIEAGIGGDAAAFLEHVEKAKRFFRAGDESGYVELDNMARCVLMANEGLSPRCMAFAALVKSVDGIAADDISDGGLKRTADLLGFVPKNEMDGALSAAKKKIDTELEAYFPRLFDSSAQKESALSVKRIIALSLEEITDGKDNKEAMERVERDILRRMRPPRFDGKANAEIRHDRDFENMCLIISQELHIDAKGMTTLEYYNAGEYLEKRNEERRKALKTK